MALSAAVSRWTPDQRKRLDWLLAHRQLWSELPSRRGRWTPEDERRATVVATLLRYDGLYSAKTGLVDICVALPMYLRALRS